MVRSTAYTESGCYFLRTYVMDSFSLFLHFSLSFKDRVLTYGREVVFFSIAGDGSTGFDLRAVCAVM